METRNIFCRVFGHRWRHYGMASKCFVCGEFWTGIERCGICGGKILFKDEKKPFYYCSKKGCLPKKYWKTTKKKYLKNKKEIYESKGIIPNLLSRTLKVQHRKRGDSIISSFFYLFF